MKVRHQKVEIWTSHKPKKETPLKTRVNACPPASTGGGGGGGERGEGGTFWPGDRGTVGTPSSLSSTVGF